MDEYSSILIVSDSHGEVPALTAVFKWAKSLAVKNTGNNGNKPAINAAFFLGDGAGDLEAAAAESGFILPWYKVRGNVDPYFSIPDYLVLDIPESGQTGFPSRKCFLVHGNRHGVGSGTQIIAAAARDAGAEAAFFGHTHVPHCSVQNGIFVLNPGSIGRPRSDAGPTFAVLECPPTGLLRARFFGLVTNRRKITIKELEL